MAPGTGLITISLGLRGPRASQGRGPSEAVCVADTVASWTASSALAWPRSCESSLGARPRHWAVLCQACQVLSARTIWTCRVGRRSVSWTCWCLLAGSSAPLPQHLWGTGEPPLLPCSSGMPHSRPFSHHCPVALAVLARLASFLFQEHPAPSHPETLHLLPLPITLLLACHTVRPFSSFKDPPFRLFPPACASQWLSCHLVDFL